MPDDKRTAADLALQAFLYANAELDDPEREVFEGRLGQDQATREALAQAVQLTLAAAGSAPRPDPSYRQNVRDRLHPSWWRKLLGRRTYRGHPLLWAGLGAVAALFLALTAGPLLDLFPASQERVVVVQVPPKGTPAEERLAPVGETAQLWADLNNHDHLRRALAEANRRKSRSEDRHLVRSDERRPRKTDRLPTQQ